MLQNTHLMQEQSMILSKPYWKFSVQCRQEQSCSCSRAWLHYLRLQHCTPSLAMASHQAGRVDRVKPRRRVEDPPEAGQPLDCIRAESLEISLEETMATCTRSIVSNGSVNFLMADPRHDAIRLTSMAIVSVTRTHRYPWYNIIPDIIPDIMPDIIPDFTFKN